MSDLLTAAVALLRISASVLRGNGNSTSDEVYSVADLIDATADLIETMAAHAYTQSERITQAYERIEAMRAALVEARVCIRIHRHALAESARHPDGSFDVETTKALADYDRDLSMIDAALGDDK